MDKELQNSAWTALPRAFKEYVKDVIYASEDTEHKQFMEEIFGKSNLVSEIKDKTSKAKVKATGKIIEVSECIDYNMGIVYFLDVNDDDADPYDFYDLEFLKESDQNTNCEKE